MGFFFRVGSKKSWTSEDVGEGLVQAEKGQQIVHGEDAVHSGAATSGRIEEKNAEIFGQTHTSSQFVRS